MARIELKSVEDVSVIRKFSIFFILLSAVPFLLLLILFFIFYVAGDVESESGGMIGWAFFIVGFFMCVSFFAIRRSLTNLNRISQEFGKVLDGGNPGQVKLEEKGDNEIAKISRSFNELVEKLQNSIEDLEKSKSMLQEVLAIVAGGVSSTEDIDNFLDLILRTTVGAVIAETGLLLMIDDKNNELVVKSSYGVGEKYYPKGKKISLEDENVRWVIKQQKPLLVSRLSQHSSAIKNDEDIAFLPPLICVPLMFQNKILGLISINSPGRQKNFQEDELVILSNIASQVALAIENSRLNSDAQNTYLETINALAMAVEARDYYSRGHSDRVGEFAVKIGEKIGLDDQLIKTIKEAAVLHDVGKIGISDSILLKPGRLTDVERSIMQQHPLIGEGIIIPLHNFDNLRDPIRHHHEWLDGTGYPDHLKGDDVSIAARILAVADSFDAMTSKRPYRDAMNYEAAFEELNKYRGTRYDPRVVDAIIACLSQK